MKKLTLFAAMLMLIQVTFAGGILTNTNQSAQFVRMLSRNASTQLDAVYFNPAAVTKLENGFHLGLHNQSIFQTRTITSEYPLLNTDSYEGKVSAPVFPDVYAAFKKDKLAFSFMVGPVGGGGSANYSAGLPSFEKQLSQLVPGLAGLSALGHSVTGYGVDISFEGSSVFWGLQGGITYELSDMFSVYGGVRYMPASNSYSGYIKDISLIANGGSENASSYLTSVSGDAMNLAGQASAGAEQYAAGAELATAGGNQLAGAASNLQPLVDGGAGSYTLAQVVGAGYMDAGTQAVIEGTLQSLGLSAAEISAVNVATIQGTFSAASDQYLAQAGVYAANAAELTATSAMLTGTAASLAGTAAGLGNKEVEVKQTGAGITPIIGVNLSPSDKLNIGLKYEMKTTLTMTNETTVDDLGMFPDGQESSSDLPAILSAGVDYKLTDAFSAQVSYTSYFDKGVNWGNNIYGETRTIDNNSWELALGLQYNISDNFAISVGGMQSTTGVSEQYLSDFSYSNTSNTGGFGFEWKLNDAITLDAGMLLTTYKAAEKSFTDANFGSYNESYTKENIGFAIGLSYSIF